MGTTSEASLKVHSFRLVYTGVNELTPEFCNTIYEAGCDDALLGLSRGEVTLEFEREATSFREALLSAIEGIEAAGLPIRLVRVESPH